MKNAYIYQGEEIGMTNFPFENLEQVEDIESQLCQEVNRCTAKSKLWIAFVWLDAINARRLCAMGHDETTQDFQRETMVRSQSKLCERLM